MVPVPGTRYVVIYRQSAGYPRQTESHTNADASTRRNGKHESTQQPHGNRPLKHQKQADEICQIHEYPRSKYKHVYFAEREQEVSTAVCPPGGVYDNHGDIVRRARECESTITGQICGITVPSTARSVGSLSSARSVGAPPTARFSETVVQPSVSPSYLSPPPAKHDTVLNDRHPPHPPPLLVGCSSQ